MTRDQLIGELNARISEGDVACITACVQTVTFGGYQTFGYAATAESKAEFDGLCWQGKHAKIMANFAKRSRRRSLTEKEVAYSQKVLPEYIPIVAQLLAKGVYEDVQKTFAPFN